MQLLFADYATYFFSSARGGLDTKCPPMAGRKNDHSPPPMAEGSRSSGRCLRYLHQRCIEHLLICLGRFHSVTHAFFLGSPPNTSCTIHVPYVYLKLHKTLCKFNVSSTSHQHSN